MAQRVIHYPLLPLVGAGTETPMTTIVGIICKDGLVIASDSKATHGPAMREEYLKIWDLDVCPGSAGVITGAGRATFIAKYRQLLQEACSAHLQNQPIRTTADFIRLAEQTMQHLAREYGTERMARLGILHTPTDERSTPAGFDLFPAFVAVIGIHDERPHIFVISPDGVAEEQLAFGAEGSGGPYAEYLLPKVYYDGMTVAEAELCAVHIVEQVKHADPHSGGPVQLVSITKSRPQRPRIRRWTTAQIQKAVLQVADIEGQVSKAWRKVIRDMANSRNGKSHRGSTKSKKRT